MYKDQAQLPHYTVLPLHGDLSADRRDAIFGKAGRKIIHSTSIGQTSITIPDADAAVLSGWSRVTELRNDVPGITIVPTSLANLKQQGGRVSRTKPGIVVEVDNTDGYPPLPPRSERRAYSEPEICTTRPDNLILLLARTGIDIDKFEYLDQPHPENTLASKRRLVRLGALALHDIDNRPTVKITPMGQEILDLSLDASLARMVIEARKYPEQTQQLIAAAIAVQQVQGITTPDPIAAKRRLYKVSKERASDFLYGADVLMDMMHSEAEALANQNKAYGTDFPAILRHFGVVEARYDKAVEVFKRVCAHEDISAEIIKKVTLLERRKEAITCQIAGADEIFVNAMLKDYFDKRGGRRVLGRTSVIDTAPPLVIGTPFNITSVRGKKFSLKPLILQASAVSIGALMEHAPNRIQRQVIPGTQALSADGTVSVKHDIFFDETKIGQVRSSEIPRADLQRFLARVLLTGEGLPSELQEQLPNSRKFLKQLLVAKSIQHRTHVKLHIDKKVDQAVRELLAMLPEDAVTAQTIDPHIKSRRASSFVRPTRRKHIGAIIEAAPREITIPDDDHDHTITVDYKHGSAYITFAPHQRHLITETIKEHFLPDYRIYVRIQRDRNFRALKDAVEHYAAPSRRARRKANEVDGSDGQPADIAALIPDAKPYRKPLLKGSTKRGGNGNKFSVRPHPIKVKSA